MTLALAITGPTGAGKTALSLGVAKVLGAQILSLDSMQIYRGMDIGTAKATEAERATVPHHLIDILDPGEHFSVHDYEERALATVSELEARGQLALFVGGTGLYLESLKRVMPPDIPESDPAFFEALARRFPSEGGDLDRDALWECLRTVDPDSAEKIHKNNLRRVARALEIYETTGRTKTEHDALSQQTPPRLCVAQLTLDFHSRETLYSRIETRVDQMMAEGLLDECTRLWRDGVFDRDSTARQAIGYKELLPHLESGAPLDLCITELKTATRRYAKRQLTWFRHLSGVHTLYLDREDGTMRPGEEVLAEALAYFTDSIRNHAKKSTV